MATNTNGKVGKSQLKIPCTDRSKTNMSKHKLLVGLRAEFHSEMSNILSSQF